MIPNRLFPPATSLRLLIAPLLLVGSACGAPTEPGPPAVLRVEIQPGGAVSSARLGTQPVIEVRDASGRLVTSSGNRVSVVLKSGGGTLSGTTTIDAIR